jgi:hypothetical protein
MRAGICDVTCPTGQFVRGSGCSGEVHQESGQGSEGCGELKGCELAGEGGDRPASVGGVLPCLALEAVIIGRLGCEGGEVNAALLAWALTKRVAALRVGTDDAQW